MSRFLSPLVIRALDADEVRAADSDRQLYELQSDLFYESDLLGATIRAPMGLETDFASIPRVVWNLLDPEDPVILYPSVIHDYLYSRSGVLPWRTFTRLEADSVLREAMGVCGANAFQRGVVFAAVRVGGSLHWKTPTG